MSKTMSYVLEQEELEKDFPQAIEPENLPPDYQAHLDNDVSDNDKVLECF